MYRNVSIGEEILIDMKKVLMQKTEQDLGFKWSLKEE